MPRAIKYTIFEIKWGYFGLAGTEYGLLRTCLPGSEPEKIKSQLLKDSSLLKRPSTIRYDKTFSETIQKGITAYFEGARVNFSNIPVVLDGLSQFSRSVLTACRDISFGQTLSYARLAQKSGRPTAARAVGNALAKNPLPLIIPCHRVIYSDGKIGGFSAPGGTSIKKRLLKLECLALSRCGGRAVKYRRTVSRKAGSGERLTGSSPKKLVENSLY